MGNNYRTCKNCGARVHKTSKYCQACGKKIEKPIYKNAAAFFCALLIIFTIGKSIAVNKVINEGIDAFVKVLRLSKTTATTIRPNINISDLENFLNSQNPSELTPDMIRDFLNQEVPNNVQS